MASENTVKLSLHEAVPLLSQLKKDLLELRSERRKKAIITYPHGHYDGINADVSQLSDRIESLRWSIHVLRSKIARANQENYVDFKYGEEENLTILDAINYARDLRREIEELEYLASCPERPRVSRGVYGGEALFERASFDVNKIRSTLASRRREANKLSVEIDKANFNTYIEIDVNKEFDPREYLHL